MNPWSLAEQRAREGMDLVERGQQQRSLAQLRRAAELLRSAIAVVPTDAGWHAALGEALGAMGDFAGAKAAFEQAAELDPGERSHTLRLAQARIRTAEAPAALATLDRLLAEDPAFEPAYCVKIETLGRLGRFDEAEETYYLARQYEEACPRCDVAMVRCLLARGDSRRALGIIGRLERAGAAGLELAYGQAYLISGEFPKAVSALRTATRNEPGDAAGWLGLGVALEASGQPAEAGEALRRAARLAPKVAQIQAALARWSLARGLVDAAARHARRALKLDAGELGMHLLLARIALSRGHLQRARRHLLAEREHLPRLNGPATFELARAFDDAAMPVAARRTWRHLTRLAPKLPAAWQNLAVACFATGRFCMGERATARGLHLDPRRTELYYNLALAHARHRRWPEALAWAESGLSTNPADEPLRRLHRRIRLQALVRTLARWFGPLTRLRNRR